MQRLRHLNMNRLYLVSLPPYLQAEVEAKTRKLRKLFTKLQTVKQEIVDVTEEYNRDRRDLEDTQQQLLKELKLKMLIIDNFISPSDKEKLMSRAAYDDETDLWILQANLFQKHLFLHQLKCLNS